RDRHRAAAHVPRRHPQHAPQRRRRPARDRKRPGDPRLRRSRAAGAPARRHGPELPHFHRPRHDHGLQQRAVRTRHGHPRDLRAARRGRSEPRVLPRARAHEGEARHHLGEDVPTGGRPAVGLPDAAGRPRARACEADAPVRALACRARQGEPMSAAAPLVHELVPVPGPRYDDLAVPDLLLGVYDWVIAWDHAAGRAWVVSTGIPERGAARERRAASRLAFVREMLARDAGCEMRDASPRIPLPASRISAAPSYPVPDVPGVRANFTREGYLDAVARVIEYVYAGDIFQANLSQRL